MSNLGLGLSSGKRVRTRSTDASALVTTNLNTPCCSQTYGVKRLACATSKPTEPNLLRLLRPNKLVVASCGWHPNIHSEVPPPSGRLFLRSFGIAVSQFQITGTSLANNKNERRICTTLSFFRKTRRLPTYDVSQQIAVLEDCRTSLFSVLKKPATNRRPKRESTSCSLILLAIPFFMSLPFAYRGRSLPQPSAPRFLSVSVLVLWPWMGAS